MFSEIELLTARIKTIDARIASEAKKDDDVQRLTSIPGVGTLIASTIKAYVPDASSFKSARIFFVARANTAVEFDWRKVQANADIKDGKSRVTLAPVYGSYVCLECCPPLGKGFAMAT
ncbi:transposase [Neorhizobium galegae]|nr:transposase [Neorhizobium galegae]MCQ1574238.1 transposase [Neorhizobium galegae]MCQ1837618.1 transposase [Neorhizobium galegae]